MLIYSALISGLVFSFAQFQKEYQSLKPPYQTDVIRGKVQEVMPTLLSISKCKGHVERFCRIASDSAADPDRGLGGYSSAFLHSLIFCNLSIFSFNLNCLIITSCFHVHFSIEEICRAGISFMWLLFP